MVKKWFLYSMIVGTVLFASFIAFFIMMSTIFWGFLFFVCYIGPILVILLIIGIILMVWKKSNFARFINLKNTILICIVIAVVIIGPAIYFNLTTGAPSGIIKRWYCDEGQQLCTNESCSILWIDFDYEYGWKMGRFYEANFTGWGEREFEFEWDFDRFSNEITLFHGNKSMAGSGWSSWDNETGKWFWECWDWEVKLRLDVTSPQKMTTCYISDKNAPFNAELFDGVTWTAS